MKCHTLGLKFCGNHLFAKKKDKSIFVNNFFDKDIFVCLLGGRSNSKTDQIIFFSDTQKD